MHIFIHVGFTYSHSFYMLSHLIHPIHQLQQKNFEHHGCILLSWWNFITYINIEMNLHTTASSFSHFKGNDLKSLRGVLDSLTSQLLISNSQSQRCWVSTSYHQNLQILIFKICKSSHHSHYLAKLEEKQRSNKYEIASRVISTPRRRWIYLCLSSTPPPPSRVAAPPIHYLPRDDKGILAMEG